jgi:hypothetical protein
MGDYGKATASERDEVRRLRAEGVSIRGIAKEVFGNARFRGRVERILQRPLPAGQIPAAAGEALLAELGETALIRLLFERRLAWLASRETPPSMAELEKVLKVQLLLWHREALERTRALTREQPPGE